MILADLNKIKIKKTLLILTFFFSGANLVSSQNNILSNPGFEAASLNNWSGGALGGAEGSIAITNDSNTGLQACIGTVTMADVINEYSVKSEEYTTTQTVFTVSVWAKSDAAVGKQFKIQLQATLNASGGNAFKTSSAYNLTTSYQEFTFTHDFGSIDIESIKATFQIGAATGDYYFDDAVLDDGQTPIVITPVEITPITRITTTDKIVAFTFDDGSDAALTSQIAALFEANGGLATFFNKGNNLAGNETHVQAILNTGHEIGNHTMTHSRIPDLATDELIYNDIVDFQNLYQTEFSYTPTLFRVPFLDYGQTNVTGDITPEAGYRVGGVLTEQNLLAVNAKVYAGDASNPADNLIYDQINNNIAPGDIVLCHERSNTLTALTTLIPELKAVGYSFVTVSELLRIEQGYTTIAATDSRIQNEGSNYITNVNTNLALHRHSDAVYNSSTATNLFSPIKTRTSSGIIIKFKTESPTLNLK